MSTVPGGLGLNAHFLFDLNPGHFEAFSSFPGLPAHSPGQQGLPEGRWIAHFCHRTTAGKIPSFSLSILPFLLQHNAITAYEM